VYSEVNCPRRALGQKETKGQFPPVDNVSVFGWGVTTSLSSSPLLPENDDTARKRRKQQKSDSTFLLPISCLSRLISRCLASFVQGHLSSKIVLISKQGQEHNLISQTRSNHSLNRMKIVGNSSIKT